MAILKPNKTTTLNNGLVVNEFLLPENNPNKISIPAKRTAKQSLIGVTLHNTDWISVIAGTTPAEQYTRATYNGRMGDSRVHYFVDNKCAWRNFSDDYTSWHAATGGQGQGNCNTISIESIMRNQTDAESVSSMENTAKLIAWIFSQYGWTVEKNLYTHNYWTNYKETGAMSTDLDAQSLKKCTSKTANPSGRYCPLYLLPQWEKFKLLVKKYMGTTTTSATTTTTTTSATTTTTTTTTSNIKAGDIVQFSGGSVYVSSNADRAVITKGASRCSVTMTYNGKHPYHLISEDGGGVYGWVDAVNITMPESTIKVGSKVKIKSNAKYYTGVTIPKWVMNDTWIIASLNGDRAVLGKNVSGKNNINSPINVSNLTIA